MKSGYVSPVKSGPAWQLLWLQLGMAISGFQILLGSWHINDASFGINLASFFIAPSFCTLILLLRSMGAIFTHLGNRYSTPTMPASCLIRIQIPLPLQNDYDCVFSSFPGSNFVSCVDSSSSIIIKFVGSYNAKIQISRKLCC